MTDETSSSRHEALGLVVGLTALLSLLLIAFAWPSSQLEPRQLPVAVVGPEPVTQEIAAALSGALGQDAIEVVPVASREQAVSAIEEREVYGALLPSPEGTEVLVASAGSPAAAQLITQIGSRITSGGPPPIITDVVPLPAGDPRGAVFGTGAFPLVLGGIAAAGALSLRLRSRGTRLLGVAGVAIGAGLAFAAVLQLWLDALAGSYLANSGVIALGLAAVALLLMGLYNLLGAAGLGLGAAVILLLGNPLSAVAAAPELLPAGWSTLGQLLPPGASGTALRSVAFFDGNGAFVPLLVLAGYVVVGALLLILPSRDRAPEADRRTSHFPRTGDALQGS